MNTLLNRYLAGEQEGVWQELRALGRSACVEPLLAATVEICNTAMQRAKYNCELLVARLLASNYRFYSPDNKLVLTDSTGLEALSQTNDRYGPIPTALYSWYELVSNIDLRGTHPDWAFTGNPFTWLQDAIRQDSARRNLGPSRTKEGSSKEANEAEDTVSIKPYFDTDALQLTSAYFGRCGLSLSDGICGITISTDEALIHGDVAGDSEILVPDLRADGSFVSPELNIAPTFVGYLRRSFEWGGFPGFANVPEELRPTEMLNYLREGLLPI